MAPFTDDADFWQSFKGPNMVVIEEYIDRWVLSSPGACFTPYDRR